MGRKTKATGAPETGRLARHRPRGTAFAFYLVAAAFSLALNLLMLVSPLYMLQVYDRVLSSGSRETLILLTLAAIGLLLVYGFADHARRSTMGLLADFVQQRYGSELVRTSFSVADTARTLPARLSDLAMVQSYYRNGLSLPLFDLPFTPLFLLAMYLVHPMIGFVGIAGAVILILVTAFTEMVSRKPVHAAQAAEREAAGFAEEMARSHAVIQSHGMLEPVLAKWSARKARALALAERSGQASDFFGAQARGFRHMLQILSLGIGAWLVLEQQVSAGAIIAGSILLGRALAPIDQTLGAWRQLVRARQAWGSIRKAVPARTDDLPGPTPLPRPEAQLTLEGLIVASPGADRPLLPKFNLSLAGGVIVLVLGPSGAGKTSFLNTVTGVWPAMDGTVRLGGRDLHRWPAQDRGRHIGFAPQDTELLPGTISENIARFSGAPAEDVLAAARSAGCDDMILRLPDGYDTLIGNDGGRLSRGQKQAVSLSRALFGNPRLICLDEPSANLDALSAEKLKRALLAAREDGAIILAATHDLRLLACADQILLLAPGSMRMIAAKDYLATLQPARAATVSS